jgi:hypothetical protein
MTIIIVTIGFDINATMIATGFKALTKTVICFLTVVFLTLNGKLITYRTVDDSGTISYKAQLKMAAFPTELLGLIQ